MVTQTFRLLPAFILTFSALAFRGEAQTPAGRSSAAAASVEGVWKKLSDTSAPGGRRAHTAIWTGTEMIVWGGAAEEAQNRLNTGGRYNPKTNTWVAMSTAGAPIGRFAHSVVWTGKEMIVWGGFRAGSADHLNDGGRYNPTTDTWKPLPVTGAPSARIGHSGVWTGSEMIIFGGLGAGGIGIGRVGPLSGGASWSLEEDKWTFLPESGAPSPRHGHSAVWTGKEMIVWSGGAGPTDHTSGGRYDPAAKTWTATSLTNAPDGRVGGIAEWTGKEMIIWGGGSTRGLTRSGGRYDPVRNVWTPVTLAGAPADAGQCTVWTGTELILWGTGASGIEGARYSPAGNRWRGLTTAGAPAARNRCTAVWTGREMVVWGGMIPGTYSGKVFNETFSFTPGPVKAVK